MSIRDELIKEICNENGITIQHLSQDYILRLTKGERVRHIFGPYWDINSASADRLACDKAGCYIVMESAGVHAIEHIIIYNPLRWAYLLEDKGTMLDLVAYFEANNRRIVAKPNQGAQGHGVRYCDTLLSLERAVQTTFLTEPAVALSPYHEISTEYRVFYLNGRAYYMYGKTKGDDWRHNLAQGAKAFEVNDDVLQAKLADLAVQAARSIDINFATIDIALLENDALAIMEINSGVQAQYLLEQLPHKRDTVKSIYANAICSMFEIS